MDFHIPISISGILVFSGFLDLALRDSSSKAFLTLEVSMILVPVSNSPSETCSYFVSKRNLASRFLPLDGKSHETRVQCRSLFYSRFLRKFKIPWNLDLGRGSFPDLKLDKRISNVLTLKNLVRFKKKWFSSISSPKFLLIWTLRCRNVWIFILLEKW